MPELPEVETTRAGIAPCIEGRVISNAIVRCAKLRYPVPKNLAKVVAGQVVIRVWRRGKYLLVQLGQGTILIHLGMSGNLRMVNEATPVKKHEHVDLVMEGGLCLRYTDPRKFGSVLWVDGDVSDHHLLKKLGPEPLERMFTSGYLFSQAVRRKINIKALLMDSQVVVGVGNIYANEVLFLAGIDPRSQCTALSGEDCARIVKAIKQVLRKAIKAGGTTLRDFVNSEGRPGYFQQKLYVYGRSGEACYHCDGVIQTFRLGQRSTYCCPICQIPTG